MAKDLRLQYEGQDTGARCVYAKHSEVIDIHSLSAVKGEPAAFDRSEIPKFIAWLQSIAKEK
jgi:hypothetical protein